MFTSTYIYIYIHFEAKMGRDKQKKRVKVYHQDLKNKKINKIFAFFSELWMFKD